MADSQHLYGKTCFSQNLTRQPVGVGQVKSFTHLFSKFLFFALFLVAIPLFPSQAPDFINQTVLTKFWDLFHLLFIGLAVSYGLFCRRNVAMDTETHSSYDDPQSFVSNVLQVSSIFGDDSDNSFGYSENYKGNFSVKSEQTNTGSLNTANNVTQAWSSQYFRGESMVVIDQPSQAFNEHAYKPLGLPVRSLRSRLSNQGSPEICNRSESSPASTDSSHNLSSSHVVRNENFGHLGPLNLENKFNEAVGLSSSIPWRSRSGRMETRKDADIATHASHFRPLSVDEAQFESLKSQSFWYSDSYSSQPCSMSNSPSRLSSSGTLSSELEKLKMDETLKEKSFRNSYPPTSIPANGKTSLNALRIRRYTDGSLFEKNAGKSFEDNLKDRNGGEREYPLGLKDDLKDMSGSKINDSLGLKDDLKDRSGSKREDPLGLLKDDFKDKNGSKREYPLGRNEWRSSLKLDENPRNPVKASSRGKSVRTIRTHRFTEKATSVAGNVEKKGVLKGKNEMKSEGFDNQSTSARKQDLDNHYPMQKPTFSEFAVESKEESASEVENSQLNSNQEAVTKCVNDAADSDSNEVDKKAGEFIARFREQIRLQKMASMDRSKGLNYFT
ncbi:uncharacterized protein LOC123216445 [Mangifera indica]|uniref:uncharacterized protein LOC123216445 n=1 Tax=Mangifera indica TaxID=29780 RepID=UPI001CFBAC84|nr:uncharacterized protein LOC123216445 [Mangifera indica]